MRIAVLSDVHSNLEALEAVLRVADEAEVSATYVLGDIVGYNADPVAVLERLAGRPAATLIAGNHDLAATGRFDTRWFNSVAAAAIDWTRDQIGGWARDLLNTLTPRTTQEPVLLVHGSVLDPAAEYVTNVDKARDSFDADPFDLCFFGHTHLPTCFTMEHGAVTGSVLADGEVVRVDPRLRLMLNPGSVGQPRDGDPRASFIIYDTEGAIAVVHRVAYDIDKAQQKIRAAGLPLPLAERLAEGR